MRTIGSLLALALLSACSSAGSGAVKDGTSGESHATSASPATSLSAPPVTSSAPVPSAAGSAKVVPVPLPGGPPGIGFDDLRFSADLGRVLVPGGRSGALLLIDPATLDVTAISGFSAAPSFAGGHDFGVTSVDADKSRLFATDRTSQKVVIMDSASRKIVADAKLAAGPDYVRWVAAASELWVTEPDADQIEIFSLPAGPGSKPVHSAIIATKGGPESLVIDAKRGRAYTHLWKGATLSIDLKTRTIAATWPNGCDGSRGIDLDEENGILLVGCAEGKAVTLDVTTGKQLSSVTSGSGVDIIAFDRDRRHLYFPGGKSKTMAILGVSLKGDLTLLGTVPTAEGAHCVTADHGGNAYVCDPKGGQLLKVVNPYPASR